MTAHEISPFIVEKISLICEGYSLSKIFEMINYNISGGKNVRFDILSHVTNNSKLCVLEEDKFLVGFCMELFHASFILSDDIVDNSLIRRNKPCFHLSRKMKALRDSRFLISLIHKLLKTLKNNSNKLRKIIDKCFYDTCLGQAIDTKHKERDEYTFKMYKTICELKTSSYSVYMPLACGYILGDRDCPYYLEQLTNLIGLIYQMNDDYLNFFPEKTNKTSNDLDEYKLTYFTAKLNEENTNGKDVESFFNKKGVSEYIKKWIFSYFEKYQVEKKMFVEESRKMIQKEDENDLLFLYNILKRYELN